MRISDWSSDVCSSDLVLERRQRVPATLHDLVSVRVAIVQKSIGLAAVIGPEVRRHGVRMRHDDRVLPADPDALRDNHRSLRKVDAGLILDQPQPGQVGARQRIAEVEHRRLNAGCAVNATVARLVATLLRARDATTQTPFPAKCYRTPLP